MSTSSDPTEVAVVARLQLAEALLATSEHSEALEQFSAVLALEPANLRALQGAASAADLLGDERRASGYRQLLTALGHGSPVAPPTQEADEPTPVLRVPSPERLRVLHKDEPADLDWMAEQPAVTLDDVAGMESVKRRLQMAFLGPLRNPELRRLYGKSLRGGLLLFGPPGCGKTFVARATAGELGAKFISVGLSDVLDMWFGESERKLHEIFESARRAAPAVIFFDELDAVGRKRSELRNSGGRNLVAQLLSEMDGIDSTNDGVFVLGASNHPWDVDTALQRPGRFDRLALVLPPDLPAREAILRLHIANRPTEGVDIGWIASHTKDFSGADLAHLCESAAELAMEDSLETGTVRPIRTTDFRKAVKELRPSTRQWFDAARNYVMFANDSGMYDDLLAYMREHKLL